MKSIVEELRANSENGAKRLENEYKAKLMAVALRLCADKASAEALVYRTFEEVIASLDNYTEQSAFFTWMCKILVNCHAKDTRRKSSETVVFTDVVPDAPDDGAEKVVEAVDAGILRDAIENLPPDMKEAVILRYFMDQPVAKIAQILTLPIGTVKSRLHYARVLLGKRLGANLKKPAVVAAVAALLFAATAAVAILSDDSTVGRVDSGASMVGRVVPNAPSGGLGTSRPTTDDPQIPSPPKETQPMKTLAKSAAMVATALVLPASYGGVQATGGMTKIVDNAYMVHTFTNSGTFTVTQGGKVDVLVVAGGGGGGSSNWGGGGGGAGGVVYQENLTITSGVFTVTVGAGGAGAAEGVKAYASNGENSSIEGFDIAVAKGGGRGASGPSGVNAGGGNGAAGGSGGGATGRYSGSGTGGLGEPGQGNNGGGSQGVSNYNYMQGGGGGGAGAAGTKGVSGTSGTDYIAGVGGDGIACSISGEEKWYGGGGGAGTSRGGGDGSGLVAGGKGGGGKGSGRNSQTTRKPGQPGTPNTGGGGGGGGGYQGWISSTGGAGGSGIVIVRYALDIKDAFDEIPGGIKTRDGDYEIHTFTNSGTLKVSGCSLVDVLVVGGGGGGGSGGGGGGGGGAGGVVYKQNIVVLPGEYEIVVGAGGSGGKVNASGGLVNGSVNGGDSSALEITASGGGHGGNSSIAGTGGASGGGAAGYVSANPVALGGGSRIEGQGNWGGASTNSSTAVCYAGGGGGAGHNGYPGKIPKDKTYGGRGGDGVACSITGEEKWYGGGGGGGFTEYVNSTEIGTVAGGKGGGGRGSGRYTADKPLPGTDGENGTGGGGGGSGGYSPKMANGGKGGDGIVIIRCKRIHKGVMLIVL